VRVVFVGAHRRQPHQEQRHKRNERRPGIVCSGLSEPEKRQPVGPAPARRKAAPASPTGLPVSTLPTRLQQAKKTIVVASCPTIATVSGGFRSINLR